MGSKTIEQQPAREHKLKRLSVVSWALSWYVLMLVSGLVIGEAAYYLWPHMFMLFLGLESYPAFIGSLVLGAVSIWVAAKLISRSRLVKRLGGVSKSIAGVVCVVATLCLLVFMAWNVAVYFGWPTMV